MLDVERAVGIDGQRAGAIAGDRGAVVEREDGAGGDVADVDRAVVLDTLTPSSVAPLWQSFAPFSTSSVLPKLIVSVPVPPPLKTVVDVVEGDIAGFRIGYEALAWGRYVKDWMAAWDIVSAADRPNLGVVLDSFHACVRGNPIEPMAALPADRIALAQIADAPAIQMDPLSLSRHYRCYPGQGEYPLIDFLDAITRSGYRGPVSLEIFNDQFRGASANAIALDGLRSLRVSGEQLAAKREKRGEPPLPDFAPLPKAPRVDAVEFIEFAVSEGESVVLAGLLEGLGLRRIAHHRSKDVDLYRQGAINIVLNRERESFAHSFNLLHGASVCALALRVDKVEQALERASAMECPTYFGKIGPGETLIPAVGGVEGSLIYFIDDESAAHWERDFVAEGDDRGDRRAEEDRPSFQRRAAERIPDLVAFLQIGARISRRTAGRGRRSARRLLQQVAAQPQRRGPHRPQCFGRRRDGGLAIS